MTRRCNLDGQPVDPQAQAAIDRFTTWLQNSGSPAPMPPTNPHDHAQAQEYAVRLDAWQQSRTPEQLAFVRECLQDPEWREFLGLDPLPDPAPSPQESPDARA